jgi:hypothetical protein
MRTFAYFGFVVFLIGFAGNKTLAERGAPEKVPPVKLNGVNYEVPHWKSDIEKIDPKCEQNGGYVVAKDEKTGKVLWFAKIYAVKYDPKLVKDVQDCFITELFINEGKLIVFNERQVKFELDPATQAVRILKGDVIFLGQLPDGERRIR